MYKVAIGSVAALWVWASVLTVSAQLADPIPAAIVPGALTLRIVDWIQVPESGTPLQAARINLAYHSRDASGRLFVNDQRGFLYVIDDDTISLYLHLNGILTDALDIYTFGRGFHAFSFHPDFASNGIFYTVHMENPSTGTPDLLQTEGSSVAVHSIVTEWTATNPAANVFSGAHREMLRIEEPHFAHTIQQIDFNPNALPGDDDYGMLYIAQGDGGLIATNRPQSPDSPHGSILRIDPAGTNSSSGRYGIPPDNPFAADADPTTLDEIWAWGFRNPHRFSWDTGGNGKMLIGDIGQTNIEEINLGEAGQNYGWNVREGTFMLDTATIDWVFPLPADDFLNGFRYPVAQYDHDDGSAVVAGFVYRGTAIPELVGQYLFGDIVNGRIFYVDIEYLVAGQQAQIKELNLVDADDLPTNLLTLVADVRADLRFGIDEDQEIVVLTKTDGKIRRLETLNPPDSDGDLVFDPVDNCQLVANPDQRDTDFDGFGNICDGDLNNDNIVNFTDVFLFGEVFLSSDPHADFNGDGVVNFLDIVVLQNGFLMPPGP